MKTKNKICRFAVNVWNEVVRVPRLLNEIRRLLVLKVSLLTKRVRMWYFAAQTARTIGSRRKRMYRRTAILNTYTYCRAAETPLPLFIRATQHKDYEALRRCGHPDKALLQEAHASLMLEFAALSGNREYKSIVYTYKKMAGISARLLRLQLLLRSQSLGNDVTKQLRAATGGRSVNAYIQGAVKERDRLLANIQRYSDVDETGNLDFDRVLVDLSMWLKVVLRPEDLTVARFAHYIADFHEYLNHKRHGRSS